MKFPNFVVNAILFGCVAVLQYVLNHFGELHIPAIYAPLAMLAVSTVIKMLQEWMPTPEAAARGGIEGEPTPVYWQRVIYK